MEEKKLSFARNAAWNTAGTLFYNFCLWTTTLAAVRLAPDYTQSGTLQLAMAVTNVFAVVAAYDLRAYLVSDVREKFTAGDYLWAQTAAGAAAMVLCLAYAALFGYDAATWGVIGVYMLFRALSSRSEVYYAVEQRHYRMDLVGISYLLRGVGIAGGFALALSAGSLLGAAAVLSAVTGAVLCGFDRPMSGRLEELKAPFLPRRVGALLKECLPAVLSTALFTALVTLARQALGALRGTEELGIYAAAATPVTVLQVAAVGLFEPALRTAAELVSAGDRRELGRLMGKIAALVAGLTAAGLLFALLLGRWALVLLYGESIGPHSGVLLPVVLCGGMYAACWIMNRLMIVLRRLGVLLGFTAASLALTGLLARPMIRAWGMNGTSFAVLGGYGLFFLLALAFVFRELRK